MHPAISRYLTTIMIVFIFTPRPVIGEVSHFFDHEEWETAVGTFTTIDFTQFPSQTIIDDQYADLGAIFEGNNRIFETPLFVNDGHGLAGFGGTWIQFDEPMNWLAVDFPGFVWINLYEGDELIYESGGWGNSGTGNFVGMISDQSFDRAYLFRDWPFDNNVFIDDLHFGPPIPAPGAIVVILFGALMTSRRRR